ncbi:metal tolerance protein 2 isoform X2 [Prosopis cineraria]|uniref:metal tolerance protein 2 isoform X2 n=1 Tax=Prosopis cineraria TaxID=364024 RepID=UPI0024102F0D|nr:metal tolerance protein 2 isoform X2 [Prosopis cineraria]
MGFRFSNLNPLCRSCITKFSSRSSEKVLPPLFVSSNFHQLESSLLSSDHPVFKISKRWHMGHSYDDHEHQHLLLQKEGENIFRLGLAADIGLATGKALVGYLSGSTAIIADAAHSISDVVLSGVSLWSFKVAKAPKDNEHPYGHGKFETLGALGISCMLLATGGGIAWHAVDILLGLYSSDPEMVNQLLAHEHLHSHQYDGYHHGMDMDHPVLALNMTIVSICIKEGLYWATKRVGERQGSGLMKANAWHHRVDAISSVVALIGVGGSILGVKFLDPLAGLLVSGMILKAGAETGYQSLMELVDAAIPSQQLDPIKQTILQVEGVKGCYRLRGRRAGSSLYLDVNIEVDPFSSVSAAHDIGENVRRHIHKSHLTVAEIFIHIDPADQQDTWSQDMDQNCIIRTGHDNIDKIVSGIISSNFVQMSVERVTRHSFQGKIVLQIEKCNGNSRGSRERGFEGCLGCCACQHSATTRATNSAVESFIGMVHEVASFFFFKEKWE